MEMVKQAVIRIIKVAFAFPEYNSWTPCVASKYLLGFCKHVNSMGKYASYKTGLPSSEIPYLYGCIASFCSQKKHPWDSSS